MDSRMIARQTVNTTTPEISMPFDCQLYDVFDDKTYSTINKKLTYTASNHETKLFVIKSRRP